MNEAKAIIKSAVRKIRVQVANLRAKADRLEIQANKLERSNINNEIERD